MWECLSHLGFLSVCQVDGMDWVRQITGGGCVFLILWAPGGAVSEEEASLSGTCSFLHPPTLGYHPPCCGLNHRIL